MIRIALAAVFCLPIQMYVNSVKGKAIYYLTDDSDKPSGYGGTCVGIGHAVRVLQAIDPLTGNAVWRHAYPNLNNASPTVGPSILATASNLLISGDDQKNLIILSTDTIGAMSSAEAKSEKERRGRRWKSI